MWKLFYMSDFWSVFIHMQQWLVMIRDESGRKWLTELKKKNIEESINPINKKYFPSIKTNLGI